MNYHFKDVFSATECVDVFKIFGLWTLLDTTKINNGGPFLHASGLVAEFSLRSEVFYECAIINVHSQTQSSFSDKSRNCELFRVSRQYTKAKGIVKSKRKIGDW